MFQWLNSITCPAAAWGSAYCSPAGRIHPLEYCWSLFQREPGRVWHQLFTALAQRCMLPSFITHWPEQVTWLNYKGGTRCSPATWLKYLEDNVSDYQTFPAAYSVPSLMNWALGRSGNSATTPCSTILWSKMDRLLNERMCSWGLTQYLVLKIRAE